MLKEPISLVNRLYYDLQFLVAPCEVQESVAIQCVVLMEFIKLLHLVDQSAIMVCTHLVMHLKSQNP